MVPAIGQREEVARDICATDPASPATAGLALAAAGTSGSAQRSRAGTAGTVREAAPAIRNNETTVCKTSECAPPSRVPFAENVIDRQPP